MKKEKKATSFKYLQINCWYINHVTLKCLMYFFWKHLQVQNGKCETTIELCIYELVEVPNFGLNWQFWVFGPDLPPKQYF